MIIIIHANFEIFVFGAAPIFYLVIGTKACFYFYAVGSFVIATGSDILLVYKNLPRMKLFILP